MIKISTKGRYGLSFMLDIASNYHGNPIRIKEISARLGISEKYLEQIAGILMRGQLLGSIRGSNGGYYLKKGADEYTVGEILRTMEGDLAPVACVEAGAPCCSKKMHCVTVRLWQTINDAINDVVDHVTLEDMKQWQKGNELKI